MAAELCIIFGKILRGLGFFRREEFYKHRRRPRGAPQGRGGSPPRVQGGPRPGVAPGLCGSPGVVLLAPVLISSIKNPHKFSSISVNISISNFL